MLTNNRFKKIKSMQLVLVALQHKNHPFTAFCFCNFALWMPGLSPCSLHHPCTPLYVPKVVGEVLKITYHSINDNKLCLFCCNFDH